MLLTNKAALEKANEIIRQSGQEVRISEWFWLRAEEAKDDIFCYDVLREGEEIAWPPGTLFPLFKRNGDMTDFIFPIPA